MMVGIRSSSKNKIKNIPSPSINWLKWRRGRLKMMRGSRPPSGLRGWSVGSMQWSTLTPRTDAAGLSTSLRRNIMTVLSYLGSWCWNKSTSASKQMLSIRTIALWSIYEIWYGWWTHHKDKTTWLHWPDKSYSQKLKSRSSLSCVPSKGGSSTTPSLARSCTMSPSLSSRSSSERPS